MVQCFNTFGNLYSLHIVWLNQALLAIIRKPFIARKHKASVNPSKKLCMKLQSWVRVWIFGAATTRQLSTCKQKVPGHTTKHVSPLNRHRSILLRASPKCWEVCNKSVSLQASNWFNKVSKGWMMKVSTCGKSWRSPEFHGMWKIKQIVTHSEIVYSPIRRRPRRHEFWFILQTPTTHHSSSAKVMSQSDSNYVPPIKAPNMQFFFKFHWLVFETCLKSKCRTTGTHLHVSNSKQNPHRVEQVHGNLAHGGRYGVVEVEERLEDLPARLPPSNKAGCPLLSYHKLAIFFVIPWGSQII